jgi:hypothetical protein
VRRSAQLVFLFQCAIQLPSSLRGIGETHNLDFTINHRGSAVTMKNLLLTVVVDEEGEEEDVTLSKNVDLSRGKAAKASDPPTLETSRSDTLLLHTHTRHTQLII